MTFELFYKPGHRLHDAVLYMRDLNLNKNVMVCYPDSNTKFNFYRFNCHMGIQTILKKVAAEVNSQHSEVLIHEHATSK